jgi:predicted MFS family arabinose efflux permease
MSAIPLPGDTTPAPNVPGYAFVGLAGAAFLSGLSMRVTDALLPMLTHDFLVPLGQAAHVITAFAIAYGVSQWCFGPVGDRYGKYRVVAWASAACALSATACAFTQTHTQLVAARVVSGATAAAIIPLSMAWIGDVVPYARRQPLLARFLTGQIMGLSAGVYAGGYAADHWTWRVPFLGLGAGFACISVVLFGVYRSLPAHARAHRRDAAGAVRHTLDEFAHVLALRWARIVLASAFLEGACVFGAFAFVVTHLHRRFELPLERAAAVAMLFGLGGLTFAAWSAPMLRRLGEVGLVRVGGALLCGALAGVAFAPHWGWAPPLCLCAGLGFYMVHNTLQLHATQMAPQRRGAAVSAFASCFFLGQAVGVALAAAWAAQHGTRSTIACGAAGVLLVAWNFARLHAARARVQAVAA